MKKTISLLLVVAMMFSLTLATAPAAKAAAHTDHCVCGGKWTGKAEYHTCQNVTGWTALTNSYLALATELVTGNYYLSEDIQLLDNLTVAEGAVVTICLNGHALMGADSTSERVLEQTTASTLNLCDCSAEQTGIIASASLSFAGTGGLILQQNKKAFLNLYGGTLLGTETAKAGGVLRQEVGGNLNMYGGRMTGGVAGTSGGNLFVYNFNMYGGVVDSGVASTNGGNIYGAQMGNIALYDGAVVNGVGSNNENIYLATCRLKVCKLNAGTDFVRAQGGIDLKEMDSSLSLSEIPPSADNMFAQNFYRLTKTGGTELDLPTVSKPTVMPPVIEPVEPNQPGNNDEVAQEIDPVIFIVIGAVVLVAVTVAVVIVIKKKKV